MSQLVNYQCEDGISTITMNDGKVNAISLSMQDALNQALDQAELDKSIVILQGNEKIFSAGFDLKVFQTGGKEVEDMLLGGAKLSHRLLSFPNPVIAACSGHAMAMGFFLLLSCDYRVGPTTAAKICANEVEIGLTLPYFAIAVCQQKISPPYLSRAMHLAESFSGEEAVKAGFLDACAEPKNIYAKALEKAQQFKQLNRNSYLTTKLRAAAEYIEGLKTAIETDAKLWRS